MINEAALLRVAVAAARRRVSLFPPAGTIWGLARQLLAFMKK
jgi:hypothetical protein